MLASWVVATSSRAASTLSPRRVTYFETSAPRSLRARSA
jgi:hypothetical protein